MNRDRPQWSNRLKDGRLRVQCQACYEAELEPQESVRDCTNCWDRARRKRREMYAFRESVRASDPPEPVADSAAS